MFSGKILWRYIAIQSENDKNHNYIGILDLHQKYKDTSITR